MRLREDIAFPSNLTMYIPPLIELVHDPEEMHETYLFEITAGNNEQVFFINPSTGQLSVIQGLDYELKIHYVLTITVRDHGGLESESYLYVETLDVNESPFVEAFIFNVEENSLTGAPVGTPLNASDPDQNSTITFKKLESTYSHCFEVDTIDGQIVVATGSGCVMDYEAQSSYPLTIEVTDGELTATASGKIILIDVNEAPQFQNLDTQSRTKRLNVLTLSENALPGTLVTHISAIDSDRDDELRFYECGETQSDTFNVLRISPNVAKLLVVDQSSLNYEITPIHYIDICVQDRHNLTDQVKVVIKLLNVVEAPYFILDSVHASISEDAREGDLIGSALSSYVLDEESRYLLSSHAGNYQCSSPLLTSSFALISTTCGVASQYYTNVTATFSIDPSCGQIRLLQGDGQIFDHETQTSCQILVNIKADYDVESRFNDSVLLSVTIKDVNEAPRFSQSLFTFSVSEKSGNGSILGFISAFDSDTTSNPTSLTYYRENIVADTTGLNYSERDTFEVLSSGAVIVKNGSEIDFEIKSAYEVFVGVTDQAGLRHSAKVMINVIDENEAPRFPSTKYVYKIQENQPACTLIGHIAAIDEDTYQNQTLSYALVGANTLETFMISSVNGTGLINAKDAASLDYEKQRVYSIIASATDNGAGFISAFTSVIIQIIDVNEAPVLQDQIAFIPEDALTFSSLFLTRNLSSIFKIADTANDPDENDILTYTLNDPAKVFVIQDPTMGTVMLNERLDYERQSAFTMEITTRDTMGLESRATLTVNILDRNDAPVITTTNSDEGVAFFIEENCAQNTFIGKINFQDQDQIQNHVFILDQTSYEFKDDSAAVGNRSKSVDLDLTTGVLRVWDASIFDYETVRRIILLVSIFDDGNPRLSATSNISIQITDVNEACNFDASRLLFQIEENQASCIGNIAVYDPDLSSTSGMLWGNLTHFLVSKVSQPSSGSLTIHETTGLICVILPFDYERSKRIEIEARCIDGGGLSCSAPIVLEILNINEPPVIISQSPFYVSELAPIGSALSRSTNASPLGASETIVFWDPENDTITLSQNNTLDFSVSPTSGLIRVSRQLDYEQISLYEFVVWAKEAREDVPSSLRTNTIIQIVVLDMNEPPSFYRDQSPFYVDENSPLNTYVGTLTPAMDPDAHDQICYSILDIILVSTGKSQDIFSMHSCDGEMRLKYDDVLNYERESTYNVSVIATDMLGLSSVLANPLQVYVNDRNEMPICHDTTVSISENAVAENFLHILSWSDPDLSSRNRIGNFAILNSDNSQEDGWFTIKPLNDTYFGLFVTSRAKLDYEKQSIYTLEAIIEDIFTYSDDSSRLTSSLSSKCSILVQIEGVNEPPVVDSKQTRYIEENSPRFTIISPSIYSSDPDAGDVLTYSLKTTQSGVSSIEQTPFVIDSGSGNLAVNGVLDFESQALYTLVVVVKDLANNTAETEVTVHLIDKNERPQLARNCALNELTGVATNQLEDNTHFCLYANENSGDGTLMEKFSARDFDDNATQRLAYSIVIPSTTSASILNMVVRINQTTDRTCDLLLSTAYNALDYENQSMHSFMLEVTDTGTPQLKDQMPLALFVNNINEPPALDPSSVAYIVISENTSPNTYVTKLRGKDPEGDPFKFLLVECQPVADSVTISESGEIHTASNCCDYEKNRALSIRGMIIASDNSGFLVPFEFTIQISNMAEPPYFQQRDHFMAVHEFARVSSIFGVVNGHDVDTNDTLEYALTANGSMFAVNPNNGCLYVAYSGQFNLSLANMYTLNVTATDSTQLSASTTVHVVVVDDNEPPSCQVINCWILENSESVYLGMVGSQTPCYVAVTDGDIDQSHNFQLLSIAGTTNLNDDAYDSPFIIDYNSGQIRTKRMAAVDFESKNYFRLRYQVSDVPTTDTPSLACNNDLVIMVVDTNEAPILYSKQSKYSITENVPQDTVIGYIDAFDVDYNDTITYELLSVTIPGDPVLINPDSGKITVYNSAVYNYEGHQNAFSIQVRVQDRQGLQTISDYKIEMININDHPMIPQIPELVVYEQRFINTDLFASRNAPHPTLQYVTTLPCHDEDAGDHLTYKIFNTDGRGAADICSVEVSSGRLYMNMKNVDFEVKREYELAFSCSDGIVEVYANFTIRVLNVNEPPSITDQTFRVVENTVEGTCLGPIQAQDPEHDDYRYMTVSKSSSYNGEGYDVARLSAGKSLFTDSSDFKWSAIPKQWRDAFVVLSPTRSISSVFSSNVSVRVASKGTLLLLYSEDTIGTPSWIKESGFKLFEEVSDVRTSIPSRIVAQSSSNMVGFMVFARIVEREELLVFPSQASSSPDFAFIAAIPAALEYTLSQHDFRSPQVTSLEWFEVKSGELCLTHSGSREIDYESLMMVHQIEKIEVRVSITDIGGLMSQGLIHIYVENENEPPRLDHALFEIAENPQKGAWIGSLSAMDPDYDDILQYSKVCICPEIHVSPDGNVTVAATASFDYEIQKFFNILVRVTDSSGATDETTIRLNIRDVNEAPLFESTLYEFAVKENSPDGSVFQTKPLRAADPDFGQTNTLVYTLLNLGMGLLPFRLDASTSHLVVQHSELLDYEKTPHYHSV
ncbi:hypothetical protein ABG067_001245 [Albugo candida]